MKIQVFIEGIVVGLTTVIIGNIVGFLIKSINNGLSIKKYINWDVFYTLQLILFSTGFLFHILFEILGLNELYVKVLYAKNRK